ncbi:NAD(P)/FAD-dependent oxidoreductase [Aquirufa aurantiipilula]|uniref:NAD(P)/FAD-dependent oxidoreductase n=1 Tax=Aquirufa aurantiipilula TaxID=2696561 RepID=A0ABT6BLR7_9BACT|nr:NAD(P)/FAD-dependent oxidoreductase [Aquirufa aurantiipilula]MDF5691293.1 NAD(P)/FAD-dependent oxidoreductase [Aquirufa aurantiipilula]
MSKELRISIIGGGAAGFFAAISAKQHNPNAHVQILEKTSHVLAKVKISGGGRCNVCHAEFNNRKLAEHYPRGEKFLKKAFEQFDAASTMEWFEKRLVALTTYPDGCVFPLSNTSQSIIDCFMREAKKLDIEILLHHGIDSITRQESGGFVLGSKDKTINTDRVIVTTGGQPKLTGLHWLEALGHPIVPPFPSLFTFNMPDEPIKEFMGLVVEKATVRIEGQKLLGKGPLLITHWGMSGPAILQLSAWGARMLAEVNYQFSILVNWLDETKESELREKLENTKKIHGGKMISNHGPFPIPSRLWNFLLTKNEINLNSRWNEVNPKQINKLVNTLLNDRYQVQGKTTFKEEFVTAGGLDLSEIHVQSMESKQVPGLFFAGEIMDIDGITGGFNFQAAWTTGFIAGKCAAQ